MEFRQLEAFVAVAEQKSFTKAAESTYLSQSTISSHINALERELREKLFVRSTKGVSLTGRGRELYEYAVKILKIRDRMTKYGEKGRGEILYLGASTIPSSFVLPELLLEYRAKKPELRFHICQSDSLGILTGLQDGVFDIGITGMASESEELVCTRLCRDRMVLVTPYDDEFLALKCSSDGIREALRYPMILREEGSGSQRSADLFLEHMGIDRGELNIVARMNDLQAIKCLVAGKLGVSIMSERAVRKMSEERQVLLFDLPQGMSVRYFYLVQRKRQQLKEYVREFAGFLKTRLAEEDTAQ